MKVLLFCLFLLPLFGSTTAVVPALRADIYVAYTPCPGCDPTRDPFTQYVNEIRVALWEIGVASTVRYINLDPDAKESLERLYRALSVPESMRGSLVISVEDRFVFVNDVPLRVVTDFLVNHSQGREKIVVFNDILRGTYRIIDENGGIMECRNGDSIAPCIKGDQSVSVSPGFVHTMSVILVSGLLDGINPCVFGVLLFFVSFIFFANRASPDYAQARVLLSGIVYIVGVYLSNLAIGLGLTGAVNIAQISHPIGKAGAVLAILLGAICVKDFLRPGKRSGIRAVTCEASIVKRWILRATIPSAFVAGVLSSLIEFPCTGAIYIAIVSLLARTTTFLQGFAYLVIYNIAFVLPLAALLVLASRGWEITLSLQKRQWRYYEHITLVSGLVMITLGTFLILSGLV